MRTSKWRFAVLAGLVLLTMASLGWQRHVASRLRSQIARQRAASSEYLQLEREHQRLMNAQVSPQELQRLRAERAAVTALLGEIETMRRRAETAARDIPVSKSPATVANSRTPSMREGAVAARLWKNAGQATPDAAFESVLWASLGGDVDSLTRLLVFDPEAQIKAEAIFAKLPAVMRQELVTPERLMALLTAKNVPLGSAEILTQVTPADSLADTKITAKVVDAKGKSKEVELALRAQGDSWRLVVPADAVERYAVLLEAPPAH
jgi:hypothetical protein